MTGAISEGEFRKELLAEEIDYLVRRERGCGAEIGDELRREKQAGLTGLALSGGGIRSASFCLGVLQAMWRIRPGAKRPLERIDYLSTVSGGGYIGSTLTWLWPGLRDDPGLLDKFADFLRSRGNYLEPGKRLGMISFVAMTLRTVLAYLIIYLGLTTAALTAMHAVPGRVIHQLGGPQWGDVLFSPVSELHKATAPPQQVDEGADAKPEPETVLRFDYNGFVKKSQQPKPPAAKPEAFPVNPLMAAGLAALAVFVLLSLWYVVGAAFYRSGATSVKRYLARRNAQASFGSLLTIGLGLCLVGTLPIAEAAFEAWLSAAWAKGLVGFVAALTGAAQAFAQWRSKLAGGTSKAWYTSTPALLLTGLTGVYAALMAADMAAVAVCDAAARDARVWASAAVAFGGLWVLGRIGDIDLVSLHRMYRDRLMEAFLPDRKSIEDRDHSSNPAMAADKAPLFEQKDHGRPIHLINTNVVLVDSTCTKFRGRGGDNFVLSPLFCGSAATGWRRTCRFMNDGDDSLTLATAMAISGAAVNAHSGPSGEGPTRDRAISFLMGLFGLQLGFWVTNPRVPWEKVPVMNFFKPGLRTLKRTGFNEKAALVQLSDGGHFENLGIYELVRRRVGTIYAVDGAGDGDYRFGDLGNAVERVLADFGVEIVFDDDLGRLIPEKSEAFAKALAKAGYARGRVIYPAAEDGAEGFEGTIYYIKSTLVAGLPASIYAYKARQPEFPHQSTADQFFDEEQVEAYRRLGFELANRLLDDLAKPQPTGVRNAAASWQAQRKSRAEGCPLALTDHL